MAKTTFRRQSNRDIGSGGGSGVKEKQANEKSSRLYSLPVQTRTVTTSFPSNTSEEVQIKEKDLEQNNNDLTSRGQEWESAHKYQKNLQRVYKYLAKWGYQNLFSHNEPNTDTTNITTVETHKRPSPSSSSSSLRLWSKSKSKSRSTLNISTEKSGPTTTTLPMGAAQTTRRLAAGEELLPLELQIQILQNLSWTDQVRLATVCTRWRAVLLEWIVPKDYRSANLKLGPYIINPIFSLITNCSLGTAVIDTDDLYTQDGERAIDQPLCWPPAKNLTVRVCDERTDGLEPGVDDRIEVYSGRCCDRTVRIRDLFVALDRHYRKTNESKAIADESNWTAWKFRFETNRWWRRGYVELFGKWEWEDGGRVLTLFAKKAEGSWPESQ